MYQWTHESKGRWVLRRNDHSVMAIISWWGGNSSQWQLHMYTKHAGGPTTVIPLSDDPNYTPDLDHVLALFLLRHEGEE